jgi:hypothetical protein
MAPDLTIEPVLTFNLLNFNNELVQLAFLELSILIIGISR